jgi:hypothetical protein
MPFPAQIARGRLGGDSRPVGVRHYEAPLPPLLPTLRLPLFTGSASPRTLRSDYHAAMDAVTAGCTTVTVCKWLGGTGLFHNFHLGWSTPGNSGGAFNVQSPDHDEFLCTAFNAAWPPPLNANDNEALNLAQSPFDGSTHVIFGGVNPSASAFGGIPAQTLWVVQDGCTPTAPGAGTQAFGGTSVLLPASPRPVVLGYSWDELGWPWNGGTWTAVFQQLTVSECQTVYNSGQLVPYASLPTVIRNKVIMWPRTTAVSGTRDDESGNGWLWVEHECTGFTPSPGLVGSIAAV